MCFSVINVLSLRPDKERTHYLSCTLSLCVCVCGGYLLNLNYWYLSSVKVQTRFKSGLLCWTVVLPVTTEPFAALWCKFGCSFYEGTWTFIRRRQTLPFKRKSESALCFGRREEEEWCCVAEMPWARLAERHPSGRMTFDWHIVKQWCSLTNFKQSLWKDNINTIVTQGPPVCVTVWVWAKGHC